MAMGKRGAEVATKPIQGFILLLLLFFVLYIIILSPESEKQNLVNPGSGSQDQFDNFGGRGINNFQAAKQLLIESPGLVVPFSNALESKPLDSVKLFVKEQTETKTLSNDLVSKAGIFSKDPATVNFRLDNLMNVGDVKLYFVPVENEGKLKISLNGQEIYNRKVRTAELPIDIPTDALRANNKLTFEAQSEGFSLFGTTEQHLKTIQLVMKNRVDHSVEERSFVLTREDKDNLERATLYYMTNCMTVRDNGQLNIYLNKRLVSTRNVVCDVIPSVLDLDKLFMVTGRNILTFQIDKGDYVLEQMILEKDFDEVDFPTYFFPLQVTEYDAIFDGFAIGFLEMRFNNDGLRKKATLFVNGERVFLDTYGDQWGIDISPFLVVGENFIKIIPDNEFEVLHMEVGLR